MDLVHWNAGLWDALELFGDEPLTSLTYYGEAIARIDKRLRMLFPKAKIVFATSTNVSEKMASPHFMRHNATIQAYNAEAIRALRDTDTVINDLHALTASFPDDHRSDWVHFYTPVGTEKIGGRVLAVICELLNVACADVNIDGFRPEQYSKDNIGF